MMKILRIEGHQKCVKLLLDNRQLKPELKLPFNTVFSACRPRHGATQRERVSFWAGVVGIEPTFEVLETSGLPLTDTPKLRP